MNDGVKEKSEIIPASNESNDHALMDHLTSAGMDAEIPADFFMPEVREGFYVSPVMKRFWAGQIAVLSEIDKICQKNDITWFADCGTLLGAVRHGGYIPWDDDLDIMMLRHDYERFISVNMMSVQAKLIGQYGWTHFKIYQSASAGLLVIPEVGATNFIFDFTYLGMKFDFDHFNIFIEGSVPSTSLIKLGAAFKF